MTTKVSPRRRERRDKLADRALLTVYVSGEMYDQLDRYACETGLALSSIGRMAFALFLRQHAIDNGDSATTDGAREVA